MLTIVLLFFIGKYFYELAQEYYKNRWIFAILGIAMYYFGTFLAGIVLALGIDLFGWTFDWTNNLSLVMIALPSGLVTVVIVYLLLERHWKKQKVKDQDSIQDIGKRPEND